jgi:hypothetical protein
LTKPDEQSATILLFTLPWLLRFCSLILFVSLYEEPHIHALRGANSFPFAFNNLPTSLLLFRTRVERHNLILNPSHAATLRLQADMPDPEAQVPQMVAPRAEARARKSMDIWKI